MAQYSQSRNLSDLRIKAWPSGRLAQMKLAIQRLEETVNSSLSQSTLQTARRKVSDQIPFLLDLDVRSGFRQAQVFWSAPPGLGGHPFRQLLFYEVQHASNNIFSNPTTFTTPATSVSIGGLPLGGSQSFRVRVVNTFGFASIWSEVVSITLARSRIQTTDISDVSKRLERNALNSFEKVLDVSYQSLGGSISVNLHASLACPHFDLDRKVLGVTRETLYGGPGFVQLRFKLGQLNDVGEYVFEPLGAGRMILSARPGLLETADLKVKSPTAFGTLMTPFFTVPTTDPVVIRLEAAKMTGSSWKGRLGRRAEQISDPLLFIRNGRLIEVLDT